MFELGSEEFEVRERAEAELQKHGHQNLLLIKKLIEEFGRRDLEIKTRGKRLVEQIKRAIAEKDMLTTAREDQISCQCPGSDEHVQLL